MENTIVILEDNHEIRESLAILINGTPGFKCLDTFDNVNKAIQQIPALKPDVALIDIHLPGGSGIECIAALKPNCPQTQFLIFSIFEDPENIFNALAAGATGYITKNTPPNKILEALNDIKNGGSPMSSQIARKVISSFQSRTISDQIQLLSARENEILEYLSKGFRYKEIASKTFISTETVRTHIRNIYEKLQVNSRTEALNKVYGSGERKNTTKVVL